MRRLLPSWLAFVLMPCAVVSLHADKIEPTTRADARVVVTGQVEGVFRGTRPPILKDTYIVSLRVTAVEKGALEKQQLIAVRFRHAADAGPLPILAADFKPALTRVKVFLGKRGSDGLFAPACADWIEAVPARRASTAMN